LSNPLRDVAIAFQQLQQARYDADYNHMADFTRPETLSLVQTAEDAMRKLNAARTTGDYERLVAFLALKSKL
jgi:predicted lipid-binding transport protein (Tim44 family)